MASMLARLLSAVLGVWLMAAPAVLGYSAPASTVHRIVGPVICSMAIIAIWEVTRPLRRVNTLLGVWLILSPWFLGYETAPLLNSLVVGVLVTGLSLVRGRVEGRLGGGWSMLWHRVDPD